MNAKNILEKAITAHKKRDYGQALLNYQKAIELDPTLARAHHNLATIYFEMQKHDEAFHHASQAYATDRDNPDFQCSLGMCFFIKGDNGKSEALLKSVLQHRDNDLNAIEYLCKIYTQTSRMDDVLALLKPYIPDNIVRLEFLLFYAQALTAMERGEEALELIRTTAAKHPKDVQHQRLLGVTLLQMSKHEEAVDVIRKTTQMQPDEIGNWTNLCAACKGAYLFEDGIKAGFKALEINENSFDALSNLGVLYREKGEPEKGLEYIKRALELRPAYPNAHYNLGLNLVASGYLQEGWAESEYRWLTAMNNTHLVRPEDRPLWRGQDIGDKTLYLYTDQGVGDTIQAARFLPEVQKRCPDAKIYMRCEAKLIPLLSHHYGDFIEFQPLSELNQKIAVNYDFHHPLVSLFDTLDIDIDKIDGTQYLTARKPINYKDNETQKIIGISWHTKNLETGYKRSLELTEFAFLKDIPNIKIIDLQYGDTSESRAKASDIGLNVFHDDDVDAWADLEPFINQVAACDLVISIDNTTVHTAGALGVPCWTIIPFVPYWRWTLHGEKSPWYNSMRFYQQSQPGRYDDVIGRLKNDAQKWIDGDASILTPSEYEYPVVPFSKRQEKPLVMVLNAPDKTISFDEQVSGLGLIEQIKNTDQDVITVSKREVVESHFLTPELTAFDSELYATHITYKHPSLLSKLKRCDHIVINGEEDMHGAAPYARILLYLAFYAKKYLGKKVSILNHACFPEGNLELTDPNIIAFYRKVYPICDDIAVIDPISLELLNALKIDNVRLSKTSGTHFADEEKNTSEQNTVLMALTNLPHSKFIEIIQEVTSYLSKQNQTLIFAGNKKDVHGYSKLLQMQSVIHSPTIKIESVSDAQEYVALLKKSESIITNHAGLISLCGALSKKLLVIPDNNPSSQIQGDLYSAPLINGDLLKKIKDLTKTNCEKMANAGLSFMAIK